MMKWGLEGGVGGSTPALKASYWLRHGIVNGSRTETRAFVLIHALHRCVIIFFKDCLIQYSLLLG